MEKNQDFESNDLGKIYKLMWTINERLVRLETSMSTLRCGEHTKELSLLVSRVGINALTIEKSKNAVTFAVISVIIGLISSTAAIITALKVFN